MSTECSSYRHGLAKDYSTEHVAQLAERVTDCITYPHDSEWQIGVVQNPADDKHTGQYQHSITRVAVCCGLANAQLGGKVFIHTLPSAGVPRLARQNPALPPSPKPVRWPGALYGLRGGVETKSWEDKWGLRSIKRSKKRFVAQQVIATSGSRTHNMLVCAKALTAQLPPGITPSDIRRLASDVIGIGPDQAR